MSERERERDESDVTVEALKLVMSFFAKTLKLAMNFAPFLAVQMVKVDFIDNTRKYPTFRLTASSVIFLMKP